VNNIGWCDRTWSPVSGCSPISEGCEHCYAQRMAQRLAGRFGYPRDNPFAVTLHPDKLDDPLHWKKPQRIFVASMGDLFHENVDFDLILKIFAIMNRCPQHTFITLTKRPKRMLEFASSYGLMPDPWLGGLTGSSERWPENVWAMVTAENQKRADERIPILIQTPAAMRGVSVEPMLGPIDIADYSPEYDHRPTWGLYRALYPGLENRAILVRSGIDWIVLGAETGPGARPMDLDWARRVRDDCVEAGVPFWFKKDSRGNHELDGEVWEQWPKVCL
jgi:protein gp37